MEDLSLDIRQIFYNAGENFFVDDCWYPIENIHRRIDPSVICLFKLKKEDMFVYGIHGEYIELIYEDNE